MSRVVKSKDSWHAITIRNAKGLGTHVRGKIILVSGGRPYLWCGPDESGKGEIYTFSGKATLRKLARAILKEV
jgi:hypothetical protein